MPLLLICVPHTTLAQPPRQSPPVATPVALAPQIDLETALQWTLQYNPTLLATRQSLNVSAEAVNVANHFPTSLNPTVSIQYEPWVYERQSNGQIASLDRSVYLTWGQPIELGHRQAFREQMAQAQYTQTRWNVLQAELAAMVQTYRRIRRPSIAARSSVSRRS